MKKPYIKPELEKLLISSIEDVLEGASVGDDDSWTDGDQDFDKDWT